MKAVQLGALLVALRADQRVAPWADPTGALLVVLRAVQRVGATVSEWVGLRAFARAAL